MSLALYSDLAAQLSSRLGNLRLFQDPLRRRCVRPLVATIITLTYAGQLLCMVGFPYLVLYLLHSALPMWGWLLVFALWTALVAFVVWCQARFIVLTGRLYRLLMLDSVALSVGCVLALALSAVILLGA
jgi:hypothetical protein